jgi:SpoVK/Ycf46/Vps4 family AAA+-type ATPase
VGEPQALNDVWQAPCLRLTGDFDFASVARSTPGFVGADLMALTKEAAAVAVQRIFRRLKEAGGPAAGDRPSHARLPPPPGFCRGYPP